MTAEIFDRFVGVSAGWRRPGLTQPQEAAVRRMLAKHSDAAILATADELQTMNLDGWPDFKSIGQMLKRHDSASGKSSNDRAWYDLMSGDFGGDWSAVTGAEKTRILEYMKSQQPTSFAVYWGPLLNVLGAELSEVSA